jgi:hypothetical protein
MSRTLRPVAAALVLAVSFALGGCGSVMEPKPVGQGTGDNDLKRSPCACLQIPQEPIPSGYFDALKG